MSQVYRLSAVTKAERTTSFRLSPKEVEARFCRAGVIALDYRNTTTPATFRCRRCGYEWRTQAFNLMNGHGCRQCAVRQQRKSQAVVAAQLRRAGIVLLDEYRNCKRPIRVRCRKCRHEWQPHPTSLFQGSGCPVCAVRRYHPRVAEATARKAIERVTGWKFPCSRPEWLRGRGRQALELDGYNPKHRVAFEYQGEPHYRPLYGVVALTRIKRNDARKRQLCRYHGVLLISIPYWKRDVEQFVRDKLSTSPRPRGRGSLAHVRGEQP